MMKDLVWVLGKIEDNQAQYRYLREGVVADGDTFGGLAPPAEMLTRFYDETEKFASEHEAEAFVRRHELARFGCGYQSEAHLASEQAVARYSLTVNEDG